MTLAKQAVKGISWSAFSTIFKGIVQLIQLIILARILSATELGLLAMINLVIGFAQMFGDAGLSNAIIYYRNLTPDQLRQLYSINLLLGLLISGLVFSSSIAIESFYSMSGLSALLMLVSPIFFIKSIGQQQQALLQQQLKFNFLAKAEVISSLIGFIALIYLLTLDLKLEAVVYSQLISSILLSGILLNASKDKIRCLAKPIFSQIKRPVRYGLYQTGEAFINYLSAQFDQILIGKLLGAETLGVYSYVKALVFKPAMQLINPVVNRVTFPLMVNFQATHSLASLYSTILRCLSFINIPLYGVIIIFPEYIISLAFGSTWSEHAELLQWLAIYMLIISLMNPVGSLLRASGKVKRGFYWNIGVTIIRPLVIVYAVSGGLVWLLQTLVMLQCLLFIFHWLFLLKPIANIKFSTFVVSLLYSSVSFIAVSIICIGLFKILDINSVEISILSILTGYLVLSSPNVLRLYHAIKG